MEGQLVSCSKMAMIWGFGLARFWGFGIKRFVLVRVHCNETPPHSSTILSTHLTVLLHVMYVGQYILQTSRIRQSREEGLVEGVVRTALPVIHHQYSHYTIECKVHGQVFEEVCLEGGDCFRERRRGGVGGCGFGGHVGGKESQCSACERISDE